ncbi:MAG: autotransporter outer membrane beta-barrel domain-containing protein [Smithellaceae bacterium]|nr:autotransporter outer membrane beta-barrel domain-containing protein [Smithellaceae bacterium]
MRVVNRKCLLIMALLVFLPCATSQAESSLEMGVGLQRFDYEEKLTAPAKSSERGFLPGIYGNIDTRLNMLYLRLSGSYAGGDLTYDGSLQDDTPFATDDNPQALVKIEAVAGCRVWDTPRFSVTPYAGYGYRYWRRGQAKAPNYREDYSWQYLPLGVLIEGRLDDRWSWGLNVEAFVAVDGTMKTFISAIDPTATDTTYKLKDKIGWHADLPVRYRIGGNWVLVCTPWFDYNSSRQSDYVEHRNLLGLVDYVTYEPASRTYQYGLNLGLALFL